MITLDRAVSQGLGGQPLDASLYELRREHETKLIEHKSCLNEACTQVEHLHEAFEGLGGMLEPEISSEIEALLSEAMVELTGKALACGLAERILEAFRLRHGLTRGPARPQAAVAAMVMALLVFIEAGINTGFFANAHIVAGPFAAFLTSLLISLTNVSVSGLGGFFIGRWMAYGKNAEDANDPALKLPRLRAQTGLILFIGLLGYFHMTVGLVRASESLEKVHHSLSNYVYVLTTPEALFLVLTGSCLSILAYRKGKFAFDDPYPGYGPRHRELETLRDEVTDVYEDFRERIEERYDNKHQEIAKVTKSRTKALNDYNSAVKKCHAKARMLERAVEDAESMMRKQISKLASHHAQGSRGRKSAVKEQELNRLLSFDTFLPGPLPQLQQDTATKNLQERYSSQKSEALARLTQHYQSLLNNDEEMMS